MRGEYGKVVFFVRFSGGSPPLARGILMVRRPTIARGRITPACAGNTGDAARGTAGTKDHPRLRGEYRGCSQGDGGNTGSPPLARGIRQDNRLECCQLRITPACAGNTRSGSPKKWLIWDHPRLRGEYNISLIFIFFDLGSPPLARGIPAARPDIEAEVGITPACAGNTIN